MFSIPRSGTEVNYPRLVWAETGRGVELYQCIVRCNSPSREEGTMPHCETSRLIETHAAHRIKQYQLK